MGEAAFWGFVAGASLLLGAGVGLLVQPSQRLLGSIMGFGSGVLISALSFELTQEAFDRGGLDALVTGFACGGLAFFVGDWIVDRGGGEHRKRSGGQQAGGSGAAIALGALLDGIPESAAIGVTLLEGTGVGIAFVAAVFLSNVPEALSSAAGMRRAGRSNVFVLGLWTAVVAASVVAAALGYVALDGASQNAIAFVQAFAAGAILVMLADTMMPEAFEDAGATVGLVTAAGFTVAFLLSSLD